MVYRFWVIVRVCGLFGMFGSVFFRFSTFLNTLFFRFSILLKGVVTWHFFSIFSWNSLLFFWGCRQAVGIQAVSFLGERIMLVTPKKGCRLPPSPRTPRSPLMRPQILKGADIINKWFPCSQGRWFMSEKVQGVATCCGVDSMTPEKGVGRRHHLRACPNIFRK